ncbi:MAG: amidohydrolase [Clostridiales Family XIII bacterium]|jgi:predicted amidohydrolase YtcJ|nr:amidohydrolase [Clostridiales Family XIII bacterium]
MADIVWRGNAIFTGLEDRPFKGAVVVTGNRIEKVLRDDDGSAYIGPETKVTDCGDKLIMPGFADAHVHFFMGAAASSPHVCMDISRSVSEDDCVRIIKEFADRHPEEERILGMGWFPAFWNDAPLPTKQSLDAAIPDKPVYLLCADAHSIWTNSKGLAECGIDGKTEVSFGAIPKGEDGEPNGMLIELEAMADALPKLLLFPKDVAREMLIGFLAEIAENGITSICDMSPNVLNDDTLALYDDLAAADAAGLMTVRLHLYSDLITIDADAKKERDAARRYASPMLRYTGLKSFVDGVTSTYTGFLLEPYADKPGFLSNANYPKESYEHCARIANEAGFPVRLHCIGDAAVRWGLDIFETTNAALGNPGNARGIRNTLEHVESIHPDDIPRFAELGVIVSPQPYHLTLDANEKIVRVGPERSRWEWPFRTLLDKGAQMAFSTDYPVVGLNPFRNIYAAITRCDDEGKPTGINPQEKVTLPEALKIYTLGSIRVYGREEELGTLEEGKLADMILVDRNLFAIPEFEINDCRVERTVCDGKEVFARERE